MAWHHGQMARFLTDEWVDALDAAATSLQVGDDLELRVEHVVEAFTYHVSYADGRVRYQRGAATDATVRLIADRDTAAAIARGELSAQRAFMNGLLAIEGDTMALANAQPTLRAIGDAFGDVRSSTEW